MSGSEGFTRPPVSWDPGWGLRQGTSFLCLVLWGRDELRTRYIQVQAPLEETSVYNQCLNDWQLEISLKSSRFILPALRLKYLLGVCVYGRQSVGSGCRGSWVWLKKWGEYRISVGNISLECQNIYCKVWPPYATGSMVAVEHLIQRWSRARAFDPNVFQKAFLVKLRYLGRPSPGRVCKLELHTLWRPFELSCEPVIYCQPCSIYSREHGTLLAPQVGSKGSWSFF